MFLVTTKYYSIVTSTDDIAWTYIPTHLTTVHDVFLVVHTGLCNIYALGRLDDEYYWHGLPRQVQGRSSVTIYCAAGDVCDVQL